MCLIVVSKFPHEPFKITHVEHVDWLSWGLNPDLLVINHVTIQGMDIPDMGVFFTASMRM